MPPIQPPLLSLSILSSHALALLFGSTYVGSLYIIKNARLRFSEKVDARRYVQPGSRDDPVVIRARLTAVTLATLFNCGIVYALVACSTLPSFDRSFATTLAILGVRWPDSLLSCLQTPLLFLGPLYGSYLAGTLPWQSNYSLDYDFFDVFWTWVGFRNYVWVWICLLFSIEILSCLRGAYVGSPNGGDRIPRLRAVCVCHGRSDALEDDRIRTACVRAWYVFSNLTLRWLIIGLYWPVLQRTCITRGTRTIATGGPKTRSNAQRCLLSSKQPTRPSSGRTHPFSSSARPRSYPPLTAHVFCNIMGVPQMHGEMQRFPAQAQNIIGFYITGIILFFLTLEAWTESPVSLYWRAPEAFWQQAVGGRG
ncbi:putative CAAX prenyl protease 2 [Mycena venus]|uniref:Putative CAAX prenyl protease 2 n=1 Tax=Mycena venus TaxID=2733690 RepID=A0A8H6X8M8_9AGAR|nr:putative CAAX prenyl protease 2 [Mycena venus]